MPATSINFVSPFCSNPPRFVSSKPSSIQQASLPTSLKLHLKQHMGLSIEQRADSAGCLQSLRKRETEWRSSERTRSGHVPLHTTGTQGCAAHIGTPGG